MRIAYVAPLVESVPPERYGGTERVIHWLSEEMVRRGHDVTLFASGDSRTSARLVPCAPRALRLAGILDVQPLTLAMVADAFRRAREFDLLHCHVDWLAFPFCGLVDATAVHTLHGRLDLPFLPPIYAKYPDIELVSISNAQRAPLPEANFVATVHHGMPLDLYAPSAEQEDYVAFVGRISREKGPVTAIQAARRAGVELVIAAKVDPLDQAYFDDEVRPLLRDGGVEFIGEVDDAQKERLLARSRALIAPIDWPEPFGLVFIEALACGTPVITRRLGSAPEIIDHGRTGLFADDVESLAAAIDAVGRIDRALCRRTFEQRFGVERMGRDYELLYQRMLATARPAAVTRARA